MIKRLDAGEKAIDLSIEKFGDILNGIGHDLSGENCACCYVDGDNNCSTCDIYRYEEEQLKINGSLKDNVDNFEYNLCANLPDETDTKGLKYVIKYLNRVKQWLIEKGEY